jgi:hypothetical protein
LNFEEQLSVLTLSNQLENQKQLDPNNNNRNNNEQLKRESLVLTLESEKEELKNLVEMQKNELWELKNKLYSVQMDTRRVSQIGPSSVSGVFGVSSNQDNKNRNLQSTFVGSEH